MTNLRYRPQSGLSFFFEQQPLRRQSQPDFKSRYKRVYNDLALADVIFLDHCLKQLAAFLRQCGLQLVIKPQELVQVFGVFFGFIAARFFRVELPKVKRADCFVGHFLSLLNFPAAGGGNVAVNI